LLGVLSCGLIVLVVGCGISAMGEPTANSPTDPKPTETTQHSSANPFLAPGTNDPGWKFIRGPNYDGQSSEINLADHWPDDGPPVLWTRELGQGYSAFVAAGGRVFTQYQTLAGQYVVCLDADTGRTIWEHRYDWPYEAAGVYPGPRATPTLDGNHVYFAAPNGVIGCLAFSDGRPVWSRNVTTDFHGHGTEFGYACSPTVIDGKVVLPVGGPGAALVALDARTGATVWKSGDDPASYTPAFPITFDGRQMIIGYLQNSLVACDLVSGKQLWRLDISQGYDEHSAWPIYSEPHLWISGPFRSGSQLLKLTTADDGVSVKSVWREPSLSNDILSSVLVDGAIFGFDVVDAQAKTHRPTRGHFRCLDLLTGKEHWSNAALNFRAGQRPVGRADGGGEVTQPAVPRIGHANVIVADGKLILLNDSGELILARASVERYEELGRAMVLGGAIVWTPPALHRGRVFVRNQTRAVCVYIGQPELLNEDRSVVTLKVSDIPQQKAWDWASLLLGVEYDYVDFAFDLPSQEWFRDWYVLSLVGVFGPSLALTGLVVLLLRRRLTPSAARWLLGALSFVMGAAGTALFSHWRGDFVFTWPVCLFVSFLAVVSEIRIVRSPDASPSRRSRVRAYAIVAAFVLVSLAYFLACRRFSLVFEWAFLGGYPAALPFALGSVWFANLSRGRVVGELICALLSFTAFYWSSVAFLWLRY
jgi:outer membrane protein assembly factor BamB